MTKADLAETLHADAEFSKKEAAQLVELFFDTIKEALCANQKVKLSRFGNFEVRQKRSRVGRNPQTGATIEICARRVLTFRPSQVLRATLQTLPDDSHVADESSI
jgi:integration host factor subunit alpha